MSKRLWQTVGCNYDQNDSPNKSVVPLSAQQHMYSTTCTIFYSCLFCGTKPEICLKIIRIRKEIFIECRNSLYFWHLHYFYPFLLSACSLRLRMRKRISATLRLRPAGKTNLLY